MMGPEPSLGWPMMCSNSWSECHCSYRTLPSSWHAYPAHRADKRRVSLLAHVASCMNAYFNAHAMPACGLWALKFLSLLSLSLSFFLPLSVSLSLFLALYLYLSFCLSLSLSLSLNTAPEHSSNTRNLQVAWPKASLHKLAYGCS